jgi:hypothetical protein
MQPEHSLWDLRCWRHWTLGLLSSGMSIAARNRSQIWAIDQAGKDDIDPDLYFEGVWIQSRPEHRLLWLMFVVGLLNPLRRMPGWYIKIGQGRFLSHNFQFSIHLSSFQSTIYSLSYWKLNESGNVCWDSLHLLAPPYLFSCSTAVTRAVLSDIGINADWMPASRAFCFPRHMCHGVDKDYLVLFIYLFVNF